MIKLTKNAAQKVKQDISSRSLPETTVLRVDAERVEGESRLRLALKLDPQEPRPDDEVETTEGARLAVNKDLSEAVGDARIDFRESDGGFVLERRETPQ